MFTPRFVLYAFESEDDRDRSERASLHLMKALIDVNIDWIHAYPETPLLYESGLRYNGQNFQLGQEDWLDIPTALATCWSPKEKGKEKGRARGSPRCPAGGVATDCKVLVAYRVAELRVRGIDARPYLVRQGPFRQPNGEIVYGYHVIVRIVRPDGSVIDEDPSKVLGMKADARF